MTLRSGGILYRYLALVFMVMLYAQHLPAQQQWERRISLQDSLRLQRYLDSIGTAPLFSQKRQLYYDSALMIKPWKAGWWQQKGMPLLKMQKYELAMPTLDSAVKYNRKSYLDYRAFCKCIFVKCYREAIADFHAAEQQLPGGHVMDHSYDFYIGLSFLQLNEFDSARRYLAKAVADRGEKNGAEWAHPTELFYMGILFLETGKYDSARAMFDQCLKRYKNFCDAKYYKAFCLTVSNDYEPALSLLREAEEDFRQSYTINEDNAVYERYPYQVHTEYYIKSFISELEEAIRHR